MDRLHNTLCTSTQRSLYQTNTRLIFGRLLNNDRFFFFSFFQMRPTLNKLGGHGMIRSIHYFLNHIKQQDITRSYPTTNLTTRTANSKCSARIQIRMYQNFFDMLLLLLLLINMIAIIRTTFVFVFFNNNDIVLQTNLSHTAPLTSLTSSFSSIPTTTFTTKRFRLHGAF